MPTRLQITIAAAVVALVALAIQVATLPPLPPLPPAEVTITEPTVAPEPPPAEPEITELPPLPEVAMKSHEIHAIPPDNTPLRNPDGSERHVGQSDEVRFGPRSAPVPGWTSAPVRAAPHQFEGPGKVVGAVTIEVGSVLVQLFGVKPPDPDSQCGDRSQDCPAVAQAALAKRLTKGGTVSCRIPNPRPGASIAQAICFDPTGVDLGGYLVDEGLAVADTGQSYDYVGAANIARDLRRGFWKFR
jgi:endonuclease YncB( thermonuclease family)